MKTDILIFCDGGLGNRINSLASGLALARRLGLTYTVHWPINNWCAAPYEKIFANKLNVSNESISQLRGKLDDAIMLLHDEIASNSLGVKFDSAYRFKDVNEFASLPELRKNTVFYFPAILPSWIPEELVHSELRFLKFTPHIVKEVKDFITNTMPGPFYGLHLRRTDLNVGLIDLEVFNLAKTHPEEHFFVCSDDPQAERLAAGHPNVFRREKKFQIEKKTEDGDWLAQTKDDDGRLYFGNIQRSENAVIEGAIDMLILAHSHIIGYSGSTFQRISKIIGSNAPLLELKIPNEIRFIGIKEIEKLLKIKSINYENLKVLINHLFVIEDKFTAISILEKSLEYFEGEELDLVINDLAHFYIAVGRYNGANLLLYHLISKNEREFKARIQLALSYNLMNKNKESRLIMAEAVKYKPNKIDPEYQQYIDILESKH